MENEGLKHKNFNSTQIIDKIKGKIINLGLLSILGVGMTSLGYLIYKQNLWQKETDELVSKCILKASDNDGFLDFFESVKMMRELGCEKEIDSSDYIELYTCRGGKCYAYPKINGKTDFRFPISRDNLKKYLESGTILSEEERKEMMSKYESLIPSNIADAERIKFRMGMGFDGKPYMGVGLYAPYGPGIKIDMTKGKMSMSPGMGK